MEFSEAEYRKWMRAYYMSVFFFVVLVAIGFLTKPTLLLKILIVIQTALLIYCIHHILKLNKMRRIKNG